MVPKDAEEQLLALLQQFMEARAAWDAERAAAAAAEGGQEEQHEGLELEEGEEEQVCVSLHGGGPPVTGEHRRRGAVCRLV